MKREPESLVTLNEDWQVVRLGDVVTTIVSSVDKKSRPNEKKVRLCNYMDVYYNDEMSSNHDFMVATASDTEIERYSLKKWDIIITKDSETSDDIAKPTLVVEDLPSVICGYHLAILRPKQIHGPFLAQLLHAPEIRHEFSRVANGVTRFGLGLNAMNGLSLKVPRHEEQLRIAAILRSADQAIARTEDLIAAKLRLKKGLAQQLLSGRCRLSHYDSTWTEYRLGALFKERRESNCVDLPLLSVTRESGVVPHGAANRKDSSAQDKSKYKRIMPGDIGYNTMRMWQGVSALSGLEGIISPAYTVCIPSTRISGSFAKHFFKFPPTVHLFYRYSQGLVSDTWSLKFRHFAQIRVRIPSIREQERIAAILHASDCQIQLLEKKLVALIELKRGLMQKLFASYTSKVRLARGENHNAS